MLSTTKQFNSDKLIIPDSLKNSYIPVLDGFRGIGIITVLLGHSLLNTTLSVLALGNVGVEIFFVLSGFLITTLLFKEKLKHGNVSLKKFYIRRVLRILPVAYLFLIVLLLFNFIFNLNLSTGSFVTSAFYIRNIHLNYESNWFNGHFWTLAVEEQFYIFFPVLIVYSLKNYIWLIFSIIVSVPILQYVGFHNVGLFYSNYIIHKITFLLINLFENGTSSILLGSLLSILMFKGIISRSITKFNHYLSLFLLITAVIFRTLGSEVAHSAYFTSLIFSIIIAIVIYLTIINQDDFLSSILKSKLLVQMGVLSYSIYIWQQIFIYKQPWASSFKYSNSLPLNLAALFIVSYLSYHFFEVKFLKLKERFK